MAEASVSSEAYDIGTDDDVRVRIGEHSIYLIPLGGEPLGVAPVYQSVRYARVRRRPVCRTMNERAATLATETLTARQRDVVLAECEDGGVYVCEHECRSVRRWCSRCR